VQVEIWDDYYAQDKVLIANYLLEGAGVGQECHTFDTRNYANRPIHLVLTSEQAFTLCNLSLHTSCDTALPMANVLSAQDYLPFGMQMPGRSFSGEGYRFGFNGQERDDEISGDGNSLDFGERMYNSRLARFLRPDPIIIYGKNYQYLSSYQFASNTPIQAIDLDGLEAYKKTEKDPNTGKTTITITIDLKVKNSSKLISDQEAIDYAVLITSQIVTTYSGTIDNNTELIVKTNIVNLNVGVDNQLILEVFDESNAFFIDFVDEVDGVSNPKKVAGRVKEIGNPIQNRFQVRVAGMTDPKLRMGKSTVKRTGAHEVGHGLGLRHPWDDENDVLDMKQSELNQYLPDAGIENSDVKNNIMNSAGNRIEFLRPTNRSKSTISTNGQRAKIVQTVPESN
jgi:RHS repeat-associated protein